MDATSYRQLRAYAAQYGAIIGLIWIISFTFYIVGLTRPLIGNLGLLIGIFSVVAAGFLVRKFRHEISPLRFAQSWWMSILMYMYASLLMAVAQFIYFRYIDNGLLVDTYATILQQPEAVAMLQTMMPGEDVDQTSTEIVELLQTITPIQFTFEFLIYNLILGFILGIPTAWIGLGGKKSTTLKQN